MVRINHHKILSTKEIQAMSKGNTVLGNLLSHLSRSDFEKAVNQYAGDKKTRVLSSYAMLKTLLYGQAIKAFSVREIESSLSANAKKLYHCGMSPVKKSTLCDAMEKRDHRIFQSAFESLVSKAKLIASGRGRRFKNPLKVIDASTIELCLARFDWAKFRTTKGAVKLHVADVLEHELKRRFYSNLGGSDHVYAVMASKKYRKCFGNHSTNSPITQSLHPWLR